MLLYAVKKSTGGLLVAHSDGQGTLVSQTDSSASAVAIYRNASYGVVALNDDGGTPRFDDPADQVFRYTGEQYDQESGLTYLRARYYDPNAGRFLSRDTFGGYKGQPQSQNRYAYASGNPVNRTDPSGHAPPDWVNQDNLDWRRPDAEGNLIPIPGLHPGVYGVWNKQDQAQVSNAYYVPLFDVYVFQNQGGNGWLTYDIPGHMQKRSATISW